MGFSSNDNKVDLNVSTYNNYGSNTKGLFKSTEYDDVVEIDYNQNVDEENKINDEDKLTSDFISKINEINDKYFGGLLTGDLIDDNSLVKDVGSQVKDFSQYIPTSWTSWFGSSDGGFGNAVDDKANGKKKGKKTTIKINEKVLDKLAPDSISTGYKNLMKGVKKFSDKHTIKYDNGNEYRFGKQYKYKSVNLINVDLIKGSGYLVGFGGELSGEYSSISWGIEFGKYDYGAKVSVGPDHVIVSASAEATLIHAEGSVNAGLTFSDAGWVSDDSILKNITLIGGSGSVSTDVGHVYAKGEAGIGFYKGEDGKMHLDAGLKGEIGADLWSGEVSGNAKLCGIGVGGKASLKVGIGAQLDVGIKDGKFNFHIGAALGIGVELGFSIDVSDWVDTGKELLNDVKEWGKEAWEDTKEWASDTWDSACDWAGDAWEDTKDFGKDVWDFVTSW